MGDFPQIFKDTTGRLSSVRAMSAASLLYAFFINTYALVKGLPVDFQTFVGFLSAAFAPQVYQRFAENQQKQAGQATDGQ